MTKSILITGGARSGKSRFAEETALRLTLPASRPAVYIATAEPLDDEMAERIARHRERRGAEWRTLAAPLDLAEALDASDGDSARLVDCLTLWLSNLMHDGRDPGAETQRLIAAIERQHAPVVLVTNEVGGGIVPENRLARAFRDAAGLMNQQVASACDELWFCVAGYPMQVKPR